MVYIILGEGFEEIEAIATGDILRRGEVPVSFVSTGASLTVKGAHGIAVGADISVDSFKAEASDYLVIPGGLGGVNSIKSDEVTMQLLKKAATIGCGLAAICAGPSVLASLGLLDGRSITCFPGCESMMGDAVCKTEFPVLNDKGLITARSPGSAIDFGLELLSHISGSEAAKKVRESLVY